MKQILAVLLYLLWIGVANAQHKNVTGRVVFSENNNVLQGVSVVVKGTNLGTATNAEGMFSLDVPQDAKVLIFSFIGMESQEVPIVANQLNISLNHDYIGIDEIITTGYSSKGKNEITGSTYQVKGTAIENVPVTSFEQALQGKVPGLVVSTPSGTPGTMQDLRIRGVGSITALNNPLIVIDGVPAINPNFSGEIQRSTFGGLSSINIHDIESVTVLKDASATSAYGARGSNGVIVIETKKGSSGKPKFVLSTSVGFQNEASKGWEMLSGNQREELMLEAVHNTYGVTVEEAYNFLIDKGIATGLQTWKERNNGKEGDWDRLLQNKNALFQNYDISASGSDPASSFYASLGYMSSEATVIGGDFQRTSGKFNYSRKFSSNVKFSVNSMFANSKQDAFLEQSIYFGNPHATKYLMSPWEQPFRADGVTLNTDLTSSLYNTLYTLQNDVYKNDLTRGMVNSSVEWEIVNNLVFKTLFAVDYNVAAFHGYQNPVHGDGKAKGGSAHQSVARNGNLVNQNSVDYRIEINRHSLAFKVLTEYQENNSHILSGSGEKFPADGLVYLSAASSNIDANANFTDWKNMSYLSMFSYNFSDKYIADLTYRYEGSSLFASGNRYGGFWSVGSAWNMGKEGYFDDLHFVDNLRLRGSYGLSGTSAITLNQYQALLGYDKSYADEGAIYPRQIGNPDLTWEKNKNLDVGFDFAVFKGRIKGAFAWYSKNTYDLLQLVPVTRTTGHESIIMNAGSMTNKGVEAVVSGDVVRSGDFNFNISFNLATVNNKVTQLAKDASGQDINIEDRLRKVAVGEPVYGWFMRKWAGVNPENGNGQWYVNGKDGELTENYYAAKKEWQGGSAIPKLTGGILSHVGYKGFFADINLYYASGHKVYEDFSFTTHHSGIYTLSLFNGVGQLMDRWQKPGDITDVPKVRYGTSDDSRESTRFLFDGDYMRVKDLVVGYNLPRTVTRKIGCDKISFSVRGTNLFTVVKDSGLKFDPEVGADGMTRMTTPPVKSVVFGVRVDF
jgi:TonB-linked SusC/RagA family outer membrane protein